MLKEPIGGGVPQNNAPPDSGTALDVLEYEDHHLRELFDQLADTSGQSVSDRSTHGDLGKQLVRRLAIREGAKLDIVHRLRSEQGLSDLLSRFDGAIEVRRKAIDHLDLLARGVTALDLNQGQDFDRAIKRVREAIEPEIDWELTTGIPTIRKQVSAEDCARLLHDGRYLRKHAPTLPGVGDGRWYERSGILTRLVASWDHLRDRPRPMYRENRAE
jgi:hypothetical protein